MKFKNYIETESGIKDTSSEPGTAGQVLSSTGTGTSWIDQNTLVSAASKLVVISCKNTSGSTIDKGTPVYQTGTVGATDVIEVAPADATISTGSLPAIGILQATLINNNDPETDPGNVVITGEFLNYSTENIPTNNPGGVPITGDTVYLAAGGGLTCIKPTGAGNAIQNLGLIGKVSGGNAGSITVSSIMRANDVPNLPEGRLFVGTAVNTSLASNVIYVDDANIRVGIGTANPTANTHIEQGIANGTIAYPLKVDVMPPGSNASGDGTGISFGVGNNNNNRKEQARITVKQNYYGVRPSMSFDTIDYDSPYTDFISRMLIDPEGNVGIGTNIPAKKVTIGNIGIGNTDGLKIEDPSNTAYGAHYSYNDASTTVEIGGVVNNSLRDCISIARDATRTITINTSEYVGIGTTSPQAKLHVANGTLRTWTPTSGTSAIFESTANNRNFVTLTAANEAELWFGDAATQAKGRVRYEMANNNMEFWTNATQKMVINGSGNVGIGTTSLTNISSTSATLSLGSTSATTSGGIAFQVSGGTVKAYNYVASNYLINQTVSGIGQIFYGAGSERMRIHNTTGNVGIGTTNPNAKLEVAGSTRITGTGLDVGYGNNGTNYFQAGYGRTTNGYALLDLIGDATYTDYGFRILRNNTGPNTDTDILHRGTGDLDLKTIDAGDIGFHTTSIQRMIVKSDGDVGIGTTSPSQKLHVVGRVASTAGNGFQIINSYGSPLLGDFYGSFTTTSPLYVGGPYSGQACYASAFNITSDYRLKENEAPLTEASSRIKKLKPIRFNYISSENTVDGFLAHEVAEVIPEAVTGEKDAVREDGSDELQGLDLSKIVPLLTAALQESIKKIEQLEQRIKTLENK